MPDIKMLSHRQCVSNIRKYIIPALRQDMHKGQAGRIGIIGGSVEYTGAPYYAAISALKCGADLSHVFCPPEAANVIKSYSPELIVHPLLTVDVSCVDEISPWFDRLHSVVLGPGLGRNPKLSPVVQCLIEAVKYRKLPLIIDADGLHYMNLDASAILSYPLTILTPNKMELQRLYETYKGEPLGEWERLDDEEMAYKVTELSAKLGNVAIVVKGHRDVITVGQNVLICSREGSVRRCGGQGDVLTGAISVFAAWANSTRNESLIRDANISLACYGACTLVRECARRAYGHNHRSTTTVDMVECIAPSFHYLFANSTWKNNNGVFFGSMAVTFISATTLTLIIFNRIQAHA